MSILLIFFILLVHGRISPVNDYIGVERTFKITINQTVDVNWQINGTEVQTNASVYDVSPPLANAIRDNGGLDKVNLYIPEIAPIHFRFASEEQS